MVRADHAHCHCIDSSPVNDDEGYRQKCAAFLWIQQCQQLMIGLGTGQGGRAAEKIVLLRANWTRRDQAINSALAALGRNGVPVYVIYQPDKAPGVSSEILSVVDVHGAMVGL